MYLVFILIDIFCYILMFVISNDCVFSVLLVMIVFLVLMENIMIDYKDLEKGM